MLNPLQYEVHTVDSVKSTNTVVKDLAKQNAPEGYVLIASAQTNGRGRMNRVFYSPKDTGLYCSILLRPTEALSPSSITCLAAVAAAETIESFDIPCRIKWVNDIYVRGKKAVGILTEGAFSKDGTYLYAVVGIGVNLFTPQDGFPKQIEDIATSVFQTAYDESVRLKFIDRLLERFRYYYDRLPDQPFYREYCDRQTVIGQSVMFLDAERTLRGTAIGIDDAFRLLVQTSDGKTYAVERGEVTVI